MSASERIQENLLVKGLGRPVALNAVDWKKLTDRGEQLALSLEQRVFDSYRDSWARSDRCEIVVMHDFSSRQGTALSQLRAQVAELRQAGDLLSRAVA